MRERRLCQWAAVGREGFAGMLVFVSSLEPVPRPASFADFVY
jgi:hypothetical protein